jgi:hypothetical protein
MRDPESTMLQWVLFGFSPLAGIAFLTLIPAIRRGPDYLAKNGSPWPYPLYPWTLFGLLAVAVCGRASYLCVSFHFVGKSNTIFGPYFLVPFVLAIEVLLVEAALVSRNRVMQRVAMAVLPGVLILAMAGHRDDVVFQGFLSTFRKGLGGSPLYLSLIAVCGLYAYASCRQVPLALGGLASSLVALAFVGPGTFDLGGLVAPPGWQAYRDLRRLMVGLDWIASGLAFFALAAAISFLKTGPVVKWADRRRGGRRDRPLRSARL